MKSPKPSKSQSEFEKILQETISSLNFSLICENSQADNKTTIELTNGNKHIVDFYIPELDLYIEYSGNNFPAKLIKMKRAHNITSIKYYAIVDISNKELELPTPNEQIKDLLFCIKNNQIDKLVDISKNRLDNLMQRIQELYWRE